MSGVRGVMSGLRGVMSEPRGSCQGQEGSCQGQEGSCQSQEGRVRAKRGHVRAKRGCVSTDFYGAGQDFWLRTTRGKGYKWEGKHTIAYVFCCDHVLITVATNNVKLVLFC